MTEEKLDYVIAHEQAHISRCDHWWKPLGFLLLTVHWFNPVMWLAYILLCRDIEMACDERVIKDYDDVQRADYSEALLDCSVKRKMITACPLAFGEVSVKERIKSVLNYKKPAFWIVVVAVIACVAAAVCFLTNPIKNNKEVVDSRVTSVLCRIVCDEYSETISPVYFSEGAKRKKDNLPQGTIYTTGSIIFTIDWDTDILRVGEEYYENRNNASTFISMKTYEIEKNEAGEFVLDVSHRNGREDEKAMYYIEGPDGVHMMQLIYTADVSAMQLTLTDVITLSQKGYDLTWSDFENYNYIETGSGLYIRVYEIDENFELWIGGGYTDSKPMYIRLRLISESETDIYMDIRQGADAVQDFINLQNPPSFMALILESELWNDDSVYAGYLTLNPVEFVLSSDTMRVEELALTSEDMPNGYYLYDEAESHIALYIPIGTEFLFYDWTDLFTDPTDSQYTKTDENDKWISTQDFSVFMEYLQNFRENTPPFIFREKNGKLSVSERWVP